MCLVIGPDGLGYVATECLAVAYFWGALPLIVVYLLIVEARPMPMKRELYPENWREISDSIRFGRAGGKCENCGAKHDSYVIRSTKDGARFAVQVSWMDNLYRTPDGSTYSVLDLPDEYAAGPIRVILTTAHIGAPHPDGTPGDKRDKMDCRPENLRALCQRCHLIEDTDERAESARATRSHNRIAAARVAGQAEMFTDEN